MQSDLCKYTILLLILNYNNNEIEHNYNHKKLRILQQFEFMFFVRRIIYYVILNYKFLVKYYSTILY